MSDMDFNFTTSMMDLLKIDKEAVDKAIEDVDMNDLLTLIDALKKKDERLVRRITRIAKQHNESKLFSNLFNDKMVFSEDKKVPSKKNPIAKELMTNKLYRPKTTPTKTEKDKKSDGWDRKGKHKAKVDEALDEGYTIGQSVNVKNNKDIVVGSVKIPNGPGSTVGVIIDGELKMIDKKKISRTDEGVLGMTDLPGLQRMKQLAGLKEDMDDGMDPMNTGLDTGLSGMNSGMDSGMGNMAGMGDDMDSGMDDMSGIDTDMGDEFDTPLDTMPTPVAPSAPAAPVTAPVMDTMSSSAYSTIEDALNNIQRMLADVKVSEFKGIIKRLEDVTSEARSMGRSYLGEQARKKALEEANKKKSFKDYLSEGKKKLDNPLDSAAAKLQNKLIAEGFAANATEIRDVLLDKMTVNGTSIKKALSENFNIRFNDTTDNLKANLREVGLNSIEISAITNK